MENFVEHKVNDPYKPSRAIYIIMAAFECMVQIIVSGSFLSKLTVTIGISDDVTAVLSTVTSLSCSLQVFSIMLSHKTPVKRWVIPLQALSEVLLGALYLIPFFKLGETLVGVVFFIMLFTAGSTKQLFTPARTAWFMKLTDNKSRARFSSILSLVSCVCSVFFTYAMSAILDHYERVDKLSTCFAIFVAIIFVFAVAQILLMIFAQEKEPEPDTRTNHNPFSELKNLWKNKKFRYRVLIAASWSFAGAISSPFLGTYKIKELGFSMTTISMLSIITYVLRIVLLSYFAKISYKIKTLSFFRLNYIFAILAAITMIFATPQNALPLFIINSILAGLQSSFSPVGGNLTYEVTKPAEYTAALAMLSMLTGVVSFFATLLVTPLFNYLQKHGTYNVLGMEMYPQQILSIITVIIGIVIVIFTYTYFTKLIKKED